jgi:hypothetical protein
MQAIKCANGQSLNIHLMPLALYVGFPKIGGKQEVSAVMSAENEINLIAIRHWASNITGHIFGSGRNLIGRLKS